MDVKRTLLSVYGVGNGIANMSLILIEGVYDITFSDIDYTKMDIKPDVHTMRVLYRLGVSSSLNTDPAISVLLILARLMVHYGPLVEIGVTLQAPIVDHVHWILVAKRLVLNEQNCFDFVRQK